MTILVMKFGGTSVADLDRIENAADKVAREQALGRHPVVVVSAMAGVTNQLVSWCNALSSGHESAEHDTVVATGEQVTAGLMAMALQKRGVKARSWQGWQAGIISTDAHGRARIREINAAPLKEAIAENEIPVVAGFQGVTDTGRTTTLGRGGSDTSAVALATALGAERCDIYTDVDGVYTADPRVVPDARKLNRLCFQEMLELASVGSKVLQIRSVEIAMKHDVPLQVLSSLNDDLGSDLPGTLLVREKNMIEERLISGVTCSKNEAKITFQSVKDTPGIAASVVRPLANAGINIDMIVQNVSSDGASTDFTLTIPRDDLEQARVLLSKEAKDLAKDINVDDKVAKVSVVGIGMRTHPEVAMTVFQTLADANINIMTISTSEIKISILIDEARADEAVRLLHTAFSLEKAS